MSKKILEKIFSGKYRKPAGAAAAAVCSAFLLSGCRNSPVLTQVVYTNDVSKVDTTQEQLENTDTGKKTEDLKNKKGDSDTKRDTEKKKAVQEDSAKTKKQQTASVNQKKNAEDTAGNSEDAEESMQEGAGTGKRPTDKDAGSITGKQGKDTEKAGSGTKKGAKADSKKKEKDGEGKKTDPGSDRNDRKKDSGKGGRKITVTDNEGRKVKIPENVKKVTAAGPAAVMVEMIGGDGRLIASSESFTDSSLAETVFGKKEVSSVKKWWSGDGKTAISDSDFQKLLKEKPDVCFEISGEDTFTNTQVKKMEAAGISCLSLPALDSEEHLEKAVTIVGAALKKSSGVKSAEEKAEDYVTWVEDTVREVRQKVSGQKYSVYIAKYASDVSYTLKNTNNDMPAAAKLSDGKNGKGVAIAWSKSKPELISTFMKVGGVTNESSRYSRYAATDGLYVSPMFHQFDPDFSSDSYTYYGGNNIPISADLFVTHRITEGFYYLGSEEFPGIIVADQDVKKEIQNNWFWQYHGGAKVEGQADWPAGYKADSGNLYYGSVIADYDIFVNPSGLCDWAEGSVESPLEAYWVANRFSEGSAVSDSEVISRTRQFYKKFFDADLSDAQVRKLLNF